MYFKTELKTRSGSPQKVWELIKTTLPSQNLNSPTSLLINGGAEHDLVAITNEFYNFFSSIGKKLASKFPTTEPSVCHSHLKKRVSSSMFITTPSFTEIRHETQSLHLSKAVGHDNIPSFFLKAGCDILPFVYVFLDFMFTNGIFPDYCTPKIAKIIPAYKIGS